LCGLVEAFAEICPIADHRYAWFYLQEEFQRGKFEGQALERCLLVRHSRVEVSYARYQSLVIWVVPASVAHYLN